MPIPVISVAQMREWEKASWAAGKNQTAVIQQVGQIVARRILQLSQPGETILILAGRGHNGDDARAAQPHLKDRRGILINVTDPKEGLENFSKKIRREPGVLAATPAWIIDGLFGIGLNRPLDDNWKKLIETINDTGLPVLAVDGPSGLNAETGAPEGAAIQAAITLTVGAPKRGLLLPNATPFVGRLEVAPEIGLIPCPATAELNWTLPEDFAHFPPWRRAESNKGTYGHAAIWAGSLGYHGASVLAAHGAMRAHPGLVTLYPQESVYVPVASQLSAAMVHPWKPGQALPKSCTAILVGPGLAETELCETLKEEVRGLWQNAPLIVICDASALDWLPAGPVSSTAPRLITPHPGEAARLLHTSPKDIQADRPGALRNLSRDYGNCFVVLKGNQTLVGKQEGEIFVNSSGNAQLAQGGTGDLLGGYLAGLLAQPDLQADLLKTIRFGAWSNGLAAERLSEKQPNWTTEDLAGELGNFRGPTHP